MQSNRGGAGAESGLFSVQAESPYRRTARAQGGRVQKAARPREGLMDRPGRSLVGAAARERCSAPQRRFTASPSISAT